jgi:hypothetical protein
VWKIIFNNDFVIYVLKTRTKKSELILIFFLFVFFFIIIVCGKIINWAERSSFVLKDLSDCIHAEMGIENRRNGYKKMKAVGKKKKRWKIRLMIWIIYAINKMTIISKWFKQVFFVVLQEFINVQYLCFMVWLRDSCFMCCDVVHDKMK